MWHRSADSDEVARAFRDDVARCSDMMSPGMRRLAGGSFLAFGGWVGLNIAASLWDPHMQGTGGRPAKGPKRVSRGLAARRSATPVLGRRYSRDSVLRAIIQIFQYLFLKRDQSLFRLPPLCTNRVPRFKR